MMLNPKQELMTLKDGKLKTVKVEFNELIVLVKTLLSYLKCTRNVYS